jgi:hypothetical protein
MIEIFWQLIMPRMVVVGGIKLNTKTFAIEDGQPIFVKETFDVSLQKVVL